MSAERGPVVWILWVGEGEAKMIHSLHLTRDAACHKLCDLVLRGQELAFPKIERKVISGSATFAETNSDAVADVISAVRAMNSKQKADIGRATLARLWTALQALAYPMTVSQAAGLPVESTIDAPLASIAADIDTGSYTSTGDNAAAVWDDDADAHPADRGR